MVQVHHTPQHPLQNHPSGHLAGWVMPWLAEKMLDGKNQRVDIPAHARTAHNGLLQRRKLEVGLCWIVPNAPLMTQWVKGPNRSGETKELHRSPVDKQMHPQGKQSEELSLLVLTK